MSKSHTDKEHILILSLGTFSLSEISQVQKKTPVRVIKIPPPNTSVFNSSPNNFPLRTGVSTYLYEVTARKNIRVTWKGNDHQ